MQHIDSAQDRANDKLVATRAEGDLASHTRIDHQMHPTHAATVELADHLLCVDLIVHREGTVPRGWVVALSSGLRYHSAWNDDQPS